MSTSKGGWEQGWAQSYIPPDDPSDPNSDIVQHNNGMGEYSIPVASITQTSYSAWLASATSISVSSPTSAPPTSTVSSIPVPTGATYDYIVVGAGAGGVPLADKLAQQGHSVLLIEKGFASSARWGGSESSYPHWFVKIVADNHSC